MGKSLAQRSEKFWARVKKQRSGCWEWQGCIAAGGYGSVRWDGAARRAHRVAAWLSGLIDSVSAPTDKAVKGFVLHRCDNPACCNPAHLFVGSHADNMQDCLVKGRRNIPKGEDHYRAKITNEEASRIRIAYAVGGISQQGLADRYGLTQCTVSSIIRGKTFVRKLDP